MPKSCKQIRDEFIRFFEDRAHAHIPSSSLLPADDPTLLFANAGMNQFKAIFLGTETPDNARAVNTQKCIRAGGKHNDLEDVGRDCYHHTFFEMMGNWSFGDYFKPEAIDWAWELLVDVWGLDPKRLHVTYFEGDKADGLEPDTEARDLWTKYFPADHIHPGNKKDNFWEMGETGPCGPNSEIHYDMTDDLSGGGRINADDPRAIEFWNLVFIQFNRGTDGKLSPLPAKHVDTGLGLERIVKILNGKISNYGTDLFIPIIQKIEQLSGKQYGARVTKAPQDRYDTMDETDLVDVAIRVIADHARTLSFAIADGILPSNEGRGSVLRGILRRAAGFGRQHLGIEATFLHQLVPTIIENFGETFPELVDRQKVIIETITDEEESFAKTLDRGLALLEQQMQEVRSGGETEISGETVFELHATYGFPFTLTKLMAEKAGLDVDEAGFEKAMEEHRETSSAGAGKFKIDQIVGLPATDDEPKYDEGDIEAKVLGWVKDGKFITEGELDEGDKAAVVLDRTNFYGEAGGQVGDTGTLTGEASVFDVDEAQMAGQCVLHVGKVRKGVLRPAQTVAAGVCPKRLDTMRNHSATHLLNWALRKVCGKHADQAGSVVDPDRLRFDFTHNKPLTPKQLAEVERLVNQRILNNEPITAKLTPLPEAKKLPGVRAVFGEKYPDPVRVITMGTDAPGEGGGGYSIEFCGGTHLQRTGQVGLFKILSAESVAKGIRRITAVTGRCAVAWVQDADATLRGASGLLKVPTGEIVDRISSMQKEIKDIRKAASQPGGSESGAASFKHFDTPAGKVSMGKCTGAPNPALMRNICDQQRQKGSKAIFLAAADESKVTLVAMVNSDLAESGKLRAGDWVKEVAPVVGGKGGGKDTLAQAGGKQPEKLDDALKSAAEFARGKLA